MRMAGLSILGNNLGNAAPLNVKRIVKRCNWKREVEQARTPFWATDRKGLNCRFCYILVNGAGEPPER
jgi:hypothetical protein